MTPTMARRLGKAAALLGSDKEGEVIAAVRAMGRTLESARMDWNGFASMVSAEAARQAAPAFTFATASARNARKLMAHLMRQPDASLNDKARLERMRAKLLGAKKMMLSSEEINWLDSLWHASQGAAGGPVG